MACDTAIKMPQRLLFRENENQIFFTYQIQLVPSLALNKTRIFRLLKLDIEFGNLRLGADNFVRQSFKIPMQSPEAPQKSIQQQGCREKYDTQSGDFSGVIEKTAK